MARYIGLVYGWSSPHLAHCTYCGAVHDTTRPRRTPSGDMRRDYAFVEFTKSYAQQERAMSVLQARLEWLNAKDGVERTKPCR